MKIRVIREQNLFLIAALLRYELTRLGKMMENIRKLNTSEIEQLKSQRCQAENWDFIQVKEIFSGENIHNTLFSGKIILGSFSSRLDIGQGIEVNSGIRDSRINNCTIEDNVFISNVNLLSNYHIEENVILDNIDRLVVIGKTSFGNGIEIDVLNEGGGREVTLYDRLTAQTAYILATYRHNPDLISGLKKLISQYVKSKSSSKGLIGHHTRITDAGPITNVNVGSHANINGISALQNGTIVSNKQAPTFVGSGVIAKSFIILSGSSVEDAAYIDRTFIGQGVQVGKQFSAENTLVFANSECFHGEACSLFAGPYMVSHHKSTLLIAGLFSFYNAGSGSNQSNHMYKLGPVHQGILERGGKTGSFSYMLWPSRIGAFSVVIGKHYANFDNSDLPFSYILESNGKSILIPALNFFTVGTKRDSEKWPKRDRRKDPEILDLINFDLLTPYIVGKIYRGIKILKDLKKNTSEEERYCKYNGLYIERKRLENAIEDYQLILDLFVGEQIIKNIDRIVKDIQIEQSSDLDNWVDMAGMIAPDSELEKMFKLITANKIKSIDDFQQSLVNIYDNYNSLSWKWCLMLIKQIYGEEITAKNLKEYVKSWEKSAIKTNNRILEDAKKEFSEKSRIGYGIDGDISTINKDFTAVIGDYENNSFVNGLKEEINFLPEQTAQIIDKLEELN